MKTPRFWYPPRNDIAAKLISFALLPLAGLFWTGTLIRKFLTRPYRARVPVICVGNAVAGGAGKTPTALALAAYLRDLGHKPVFVTRGYGGTGDVVQVDLLRHSFEDVGDEALLLAGCAPTWAGSDRIAAIKQAESHGTIVIMDDGLQNPHIAPTLSLLVVDGRAGTGNGRIIPAGPLRESLASAVHKAAALIMIGEDAHGLSSRVKIPVWRARLEPKPSLGFPYEGRFVAFAGIGRPEKFYATARELGLDIAATRDFPDHHLFNQDDLELLRLMAEEQGAQLLTTEKDAVRLPSDFRADVVVLPVQLVFESPDNAQEMINLFREAL